MLPYPPSTPIPHCMENGEKMHLSQPKFVLNNLPYAVDPHPKSFSLRAKDFLIRELVSRLSLREDNILVCNVSSLVISGGFT